MASLTVNVRHEAPLAELGCRFTAFNRLTSATVEQQAWRRWSRDAGNSHSYDLQVVFFGKSGYGKSSLVNALSGLGHMKTSDVAACTRDVANIFNLAPAHIHPCSAATHWGLSALSEALVSLLARSPGVSL